jgi:hypothetical protein
MAAKSKSREPLSHKPRSTNDIEEKIRTRAYQLHEERGRIDGHGLDDWLQAEAEVLGAKKQGSKSKKIQRREKS